MTNNQCDSNCEVHYGREGSQSSYHGHNKYGGRCGCNSCGCETMQHGSNASCSSCDNDPIEGAKKLLESAFFEALKEVHVEKIKKIIERDWGSNIDKAVELAVKTIEKQWQTSLSNTSPSKEFYDELKKIMTSSNK
ncbi:MAG: hypothetical protein P0116_12855 [Candidatus Nitrosocosmicus sp.]|nr:hypothetical protein [Candidatus Nitrosocosmicus sp.]